MCDVAFALSSVIILRLFCVLRGEFRLKYGVDCMPYPREYLVSTAHPNVVTIRASHDYKAGSDQWKISRSSLVAHAVGLLPFKDTL